MALEELLDEGVDLLDHRDLDLAEAREATYVFSTELSYVYPAPIRSLRHRFVVVPRRRHGDQRRLTHRVEANVPRHATLRHRHDRCGNLVVEVDAEHVPERFSVGVRAVLHRSRARPAMEQVWRPHHTRPGPLTAPDAALRAAASALAGREGRDHRLAVALGEHVRSTMTYEHGATGVRTTAAEAWALGQGVCQDMAHAMLAMCRAVGLPARYVSGHLLGEGASHAWVEVGDPTTGLTLAYDPTHARPTDLRYVTVAVGRDYSDVAPTSGAYVSGPPGRLAVRKRVGVTSIA